MQSGWVIGRRLGPLMKVFLSLIKAVLTPLAKSILIPSVLVAAASAADAVIHQNFRIWNFYFSTNNTKNIN